jgi:alcohol dehydrogenase class IV
MPARIAGTRIVFTLLPAAHFGVGSIGALPGIVRGTGSQEVALVTDQALAGTPVVAAARAAEAAIGAVTALRDRVGLTSTLTAFGIGATDYGQISADALDDEVLAGTPRMPDAADIAAILAAA